VQFSSFFTLSRTKDHGKISKAIRFVIHSYFKKQENTLSPCSALIMKAEILRRFSIFQYVWYIVCKIIFKIFDILQSESLGWTHGSTPTFREWEIGTLFTNVVGADLCVCLLGSGMGSQGSGVIKDQVHR